MFHFNWISIDVFLCFQGAQVQSNECGAIYSRFPSQWICTCYAFPCHVSNSLHNSRAIISGASFYYMSSLILLCPWDCTGSFQCSLTLHLRFHPPNRSKPELTFPIAFESSAVWFISVRPEGGRGYQLLPIPPTWDIGHLRSIRPQMRHDWGLTQTAAVRLSCKRRNRASNRVPRLLSVSEFCELPGSGHAQFWLASEAHYEPQ